VSECVYVCERGSILDAWCMWVNVWCMWVNAWCMWVNVCMYVREVLYWMRGVC